MTLDFDFNLIYDDTNLWIYIFSRRVLFVVLERAFMTVFLLVVSASVLFPAFRISCGTYDYE